MVAKSERLFAFLLKWKRFKSGLPLKELILNTLVCLIVYTCTWYKFIKFTLLINQLPEILEEYSAGEHYDGIYFALTDESEHPAFAFLENAKLAQPNQHHWLRLETSVVRTLISSCAKL